MNHCGEAATVNKGSVSTMGATSGGAIVSPISVWIVVVCLALIQEGTYSTQHG